MYNSALVKTKKKSFKSFKPSHITIPLEDLIMGAPYAVTINPTDEFQHWNSACRVTSCYDSLEQKILWGTITTCQWRLYPELSSKGRFHWHGFVTVWDPVKFYLLNIHHILKRATFVMKPLEDDDGRWFDYCLKQHEFHTVINNTTFVRVPFVKGDIDREQTKSFPQGCGPPGRQEGEETPNPSSKFCPFKS